MNRSRVGHSSLLTAHLRPWIQRGAAAALASSFAAVLLGGGCNDPSVLDNKTFQTTASSTTGAGGTGGSNAATSSGNGGNGGDASTCGACDGKCVGTVCCRTGSGFEIHAFAGGQEALTGTFAQLDGKGNLEALFANQLGEDVRSFTLDAKGPDAKLLQAIDTGRLTRPAVGDVDGDGKADLVVALSETASLDPVNALRVFKGKGDGTFETTFKEFAQPDLPTDQELADLDGDGDLDILVTTKKCFVLRRNAGDGTFGDSECLDASPGGPAAVAAVKGGFGKKQALLMADGSSLYLRTLEADNTLKTTRIDVGTEQLIGGGVLDLDGDGDDDILAFTGPKSTHPNTVLTYLRTNQVDVELCDSYATPAGTDKVERARLGDFDGDKVPDMLAIDIHDEGKPADSADYFRSVYYLFHGVK